ncbi:arginine--tRNA ligase [Reichenbachiella sp. MALMAid0571]|uniref:arginine--tRNA ligase n=1 Tax=Reichenbachiella sp. MALMAid0571 TaxID=3143939 RepID=UPI0032DFBE78
MNIALKIQKSISQALNQLFNHEVESEKLGLQPTRKEFEGTYTFVTFPYLKISKSNPEETGKMIGNFLTEHCEEVAAYNVVKGFLNLSVTDQTWLNLFNDITGEKNHGFAPSNGKSVMVEYSSPNTNKPLHLGHLRNNFLGYSVAKIYEANGYEVTKVQIINDRGIHICKSMVAWQKFGNGETPESSGLKGDKLAGKYYVKFDQEYKKEIAGLVESGLTKEEAEKQAPIMLEAQDMLRKWEAHDTEVYDLWKTMNGWVYDGFELTYKQMGVTFDKLYYESQTYLLGKEIVKTGLEKGVFYQKEDGSVWIDLTSEGLDHKLILRSDGTAVYMTQDIGTAIERFKEFPNQEKLIYTVGNEQDYHFKVLFLILEKLGYDWAKGCYHLSYGMVDLPSGKMKSREGTVVDADDLMDEMIQTAEDHTKELGKIDGFSESEAKELYATLGLGALKYFLLKVDPKKRMLFDPQESIEFQGNTGPFIQYTHARISAIIRRAEDLKIDFKKSIDTKKIVPEKVEKDLIYLISDFPEKIKTAAIEYSPSLIAQYCFDLAKEYNRFYAELSIFNESDSDRVCFRVKLSEQVAKTIKAGMGLLGVGVPEKM